MQSTVGQKKRPRKGETNGERERRGKGRHKLTSLPLPSVDRATYVWFLIEVRGELVVMGDQGRVSKRDR